MSRFSMFRLNGETTFGVKSFDAACWARFVFLFPWPTKESGVREITCRFSCKVR